METRGTLLEIRFSTIEQFAPYRERILSVFRNLGEREGMLFFVALNEAVNNALIHGGTVAEGRAVELSVRDEGPRICAAIRNCGGCFSHDMKPDPEVFDNVFRESGRGVQIILHIADECSIGESGRLVSLCMNKPGAAAGGQGE